EPASGSTPPPARSWGGSRPAHSAPARRSRRRRGGEAAFRPVRKKSGRPGRQRIWARRREGPPLSLRRDDAAAPDRGCRCPPPSRGRYAPTSGDSWRAGGRASPRGTGGRRAPGERYAGPRSAAPASLPPPREAGAGSARSTARTGSGATRAPVRRPGSPPPSGPIPREDDARVQTGSALPGQGDPRRGALHAGPLDPKGLLLLAEGLEALLGLVQRAHRPLHVDLLYPFGA